MVTFDLDLQGHLGREQSKLAKKGLVHSITFEGLYLGPPNLAVKCILDSSRLGLHMVVFDLYLQGNLGRKWPDTYPSITSECCPPLIYIIITTDCTRPRGCSSGTNALVNDKV